MARLILSRISAAAALVKVTTRSLSISTGLFSSVTMLMIRSTSTAVLPDPAAAETRIFLSRRSMTCCCSGVKFMVTPPLFPLAFFAAALPPPARIRFRQPSASSNSQICEKLQKAQASLFPCWQGLISISPERIFLPKLRILWLTKSEISS